MRYLFARKSHNAVNVISFISMAGVAVATAAIVCVLSVFNGFTDLALQRLSLIDPQAKVTPLKGKTIAAADSVARVIASLPQVDSAVPMIEEHALAMYAGNQMAVNLHGVPEGYDRVTDIRQCIIDGDFMTGTENLPLATVSVGTAIRLGAHPGDVEPIYIYVPRRTGRINPSNPMTAFMADSLLVSGVYRIEDNDADGQTVIVPLQMAREILEYTDEATAIAVRGAAGVTDSELCKAVSAVMGPGYEVSDRMQQEQQSFNMISVEKWITFLMLALILVIASFNVVSTLSMLIIEKRDNMATLRALGAWPALTRRIFMWEGWLISATGGLAGIVLGVGLSLAQQIGGFIKLGGDPVKMSVTEYPVRVDLLDILIVAALVTAIGFVVGWVTSRFTPVLADRRK